VASALSPSRVNSVEIVDPVLRAARVIVPDYQLSLAIGKEGQNARLAAKLTGWRIDIRSDTAVPEDASGAPAATAPGSRGGSSSGEPARGGAARGGAARGGAARGDGERGAHGGAPRGGASRGGGTAGSGRPQ